MFVRCVPSGNINTLLILQRENTGLTKILHIFVDYFDNFKYSFSNDNGLKSIEKSHQRYKSLEFL